MKGQKVQPGINALRLFLKISLAETYKPRILCYLKIFKMAHQTLRAVGLRNLENSYGGFVAENEKTNSVVFPSI